MSDPIVRGALCFKIDGNCVVVTEGDPDLIGAEAEPILKLDLFYVPDLIAGLRAVITFPVNAKRH